MSTDRRPLAGRFLDQLRAAALVGLGGGGLLGACLALAFVFSEHAALALPTFGAQLALLGLLTASGASAGLAALLPLAVVLSLLGIVWSGLDRRPGIRIHAAALVLGVLSIHLFLWLGFVLVRDLTAPRGRFGMAAIGIGAAIGLITAIAWPGRDREPRRAWVPGWVLAVAALVAVAGVPLMYNALDGALASESAGEASDEAPVELARQVPPSRPPMILISIDTLRADHLSLNGYHRETTPQLAQLAASGTNFTLARSQAPWTLPSHATMLTSLYPSSHGARYFSNFRIIRSGVGDRLPEVCLTIAEILASAGYRTAGFTSVTWLSEQFGFGQGFETLEMDIEEHRIDVLVDKALTWLEGIEADEPFFLFLHIFDVHDFQSPQPWHGRWQDPDYAGPLKEKDFRGGNLYDDLTKDDLEHLVARYDGALSWVDDELGRFFGELQRTGRYDETLVIVSSDHGEEFWEHGGTGHGFNLYDEQLRVPLIVKPPAATERVAARIDEAVGVIDIPPTMVDYLGLPPPPMFEGRSLRPLVEGGASPPGTTLFAEAAFYSGMRSIIRDETKLIGQRFPPGRLLSKGLLLANVRSLYRWGPDELYELTADPSEHDNLAKGRPELVQDLKMPLVEHVGRSSEGRQFDLDEETLERLRGLGYVN